MQDYIDLELYTDTLISFQYVHYTIYIYIYELEFTAIYAEDFLNCRKICCVRCRKSLKFLEKFSGFSAARVQLFLLPRTIFH